MTNIVLTGFMGTGKTTVGSRVASALQRDFVDMDEVIAARAGKPVAHIFADEGEARFRERERVLCRELASRDGLVIATGGGSLVDDASRALLARNTTLFCLDASPEEIARRLAGCADRPLLDARRAGQSPAERIARMVAERESAYALIPRHVATDGLSAEQVAEQVLSCLAQPATVDLTREVRAGGERYTVVMGAGVWREVGVMLNERLLNSRQAAVVSDTLVGPLHAAPIERSLQEAGFATTLVTIPASEVAKTLDTVSLLYDHFIAAQMERSSVVLALGGGLVGDVAGFAAATFLRGVHFVQLPTTALSVVDASLGGKTAVNHPKGKNLIGAFKQPALVCADREALAALPVADFRSGLAEVVKHGIIGDARLFERLERSGLQDLPRILVAAIEVKLKVIEADPHERAERAVLNLGHTFGHAFETLSRYSLRHGEAVAMGLVAAARLAARVGLCSPSLAVRTAALLDRLGLPTQVNRFDPASVLAAMQTDKKRAQGRIRFVLPVELGKVVVRDDVAREDVEAVLR
ncbi:MAG: 3-dehydroquinate synthase [Chloroflexi bacterium]|nr:3-dehydroquinate synthase [Chloroflexota bacterium]